ncbi:MAG: zinc ribbon domain-containing protein [Lachnospiraceae bacterium]|nr:zinc ribbon domain-containing protein [Lachnospiraceae bacterium]
MFCPNCGNEVKEGTAFCPNCGSRIGSNAEKKAETVGSVKETEATSKKGPEKKKKKGKGKIIALVVVVVIVIAAILIFMNSGSGGEDETAARAAELCEEVQNGYLGDYDTVTVKEVIEYLYAGGEWTYGTSEDGTYYIVDYCNEDYVELQFSVYDDDSETFEASGIDSFTDDTDSYSASGLAAFLNSIYGSYIGSHPECGLTAVSDDNKADQTVLEGHFGPVKSVEESENASLEEDMAGDEDVNESEDTSTEDTSEEVETEAVEETETQTFLGKIGTYEPSYYDDELVPGRLDLTQDEDGTIYVSVGSMDTYYDAGYFGTYECTVVDAYTLYVDMPEREDVSFTLTWSEQDDSYMTASTDDEDKFTWMDSAALLDILQCSYQYSLEFN